MRITSGIGIVFFWVLSLTAFAQKHDIHFNTLDIRSGLSQSSAQCLLQDDKGFIWIGTQDGLHRFDGHEVLRYKYDPLNKNSLTNNNIQCIEQDDDGNLWVGTVNGLNKFDPVEKTFQRFLDNPFDTTALPGNKIVDLCYDGNDRLWIATNKNGLCFYDIRKRFFVRLTEPLSLLSINELFLDSRKNLWAASNEGLCYVDRRTGNGVIFRPKDQLLEEIEDNRVWAIAEKQDQYLYVGVQNELLMFSVQKNKFEPVESRVKKELGTVSKILVDKAGQVWLGSSSQGLFKVFNKYEKPVYFDYKTSNHQYALASNVVHDIFQDESNIVWVGTKDGVSKFDPDKQYFSSIGVTEKNGLPGKNIWALCEESKSTLWLGHTEGLSRYNRKTDRSTNFSRETFNPNRPGDRSVTHIYKDADGSLWLGFADGLFRATFSSDYTRVSYEKFPISPHADELQNELVYWIEQDKNPEFLWVGSSEGLSLINKKTKKSKLFQRRLGEQSSLPDNSVRSVSLDKHDNLWLGTEYGGLTRARIKRQDSTMNLYFKPYPTNVSSKGSHVIYSTISSLHQGHGSLLWIASYGGGLIRLDKRTGKIKTYTERDGLCNNSIYGILEDLEGNLWLSTNGGISRFDTENEEFQNFYESDGLQSNEFNLGAYAAGSDGELFLGGINGFNAFYPSKIKVNTIPPKVVFTGFYLHNKRVEAGEKSVLKKDITQAPPIELNYNQNHFSIEFSGLHFGFNEKNSYKYQLVGYDEEQQFLTGSNRVNYTNLDPAVYRFEVYAANSDGVWTTEPEVLVITILSPFWKRAWFIIALVVFIGGATYGGVQYRFISVKRQKEKLEELVDIRTDALKLEKEKVMAQKSKIESQKLELQLEKEKVDGLLLNILPKETIEELKNKGRATARSYKSATVLFADFKGFTKIAETMGPDMLLSKLNQYFTAFDQILEKHNVERIKTLGDAYIAVGGVPIRNKSNPIDTVLAGLEMQQYVKQESERAKARGEDFWELRIGIHSGEVIAGVIGIKRFAYDVWGDTVNVSSRMESSGQAGRVNISGETYQLVEPFFDFTYRGKVQAKNKGQVDMYFVDGVKEELLEDGKGTVEGSGFREYVNLHLYSAINYKKAERYIVKLLEKNLPDNLFYHDLQHTLDVCEAAEKIALREGIRSDDLFVLKSAALYHDAGFVKQYANNEPIGVEMAREALPKFGYTPEQVDAVARLIYATIVPHAPKDKLEEIICDADLDYLGRDDFHEIADKLKQELMDRGIVKTSRQWDEMQVAFLSKHHYFTTSSQRLRNKKKAKHLEDIKTRLQEIQSQES